MIQIIKLLIVFLFIVLQMPMLGQSKGGSKKPTKIEKRQKPANKQNAKTPTKNNLSSKHVIVEKIDEDVYTYEFIVKGPNLMGTFKENASPKEKFTLRCNPNVPVDVIVSEYSALLYWGFASVAFFKMSEDNSYYEYLYVAGKRNLAKCVSCLAQVEKYCPGSFEKAQHFYKELISAEGKDSDAVWDMIGVLGYALGEHPLNVCDIYNEDDY